MPRLGLRLSFLGFAATRCLLILLSTAMLLLTLLTHFLPIAVFYPSASAGIHVDVTYYVWYYRKNTKGGQSAEIHDHSAVPAYTYTAAVEATRVLLVLATILATISLVTSIFFFVMLLRHHARRQRERVRYATARQAASQMNRGPGTALHPHIEPPLSESGNPISAEQAEAQHREEEIRRREVDRLVGILLAVVNLVFLAFLAGFTVSFLAYYLTCSQRTDTGGSTLKKPCILVPIAAIVDLFGLVLLSISNLSGTRLWRTHHTHDIDENLAASFTQRHRLVRLGSSTDHHSSSRPERGGHNYATEDEAVQPAAATRPVSSADSTGEGGGVLLEKGLSSFYQESQLDHPLVAAFSAVAEEEDGAAPPLHGEETALALPQQPKPQQDAPPSSSLPPNTLL